MLKRNQILLLDWQVEYIKFLSEQFDISFSETTRLTLCAGIMQCVKELFPGFKPKFTVKDLANKVKKLQKTDSFTQAEFHEIISTVYFEARKAAEYRITHQKK
jgi:hypothetical protein